MARREHLGEVEQIVLLAVLRLGDDAYGVPIRLEIERRTGRALTVGALYRTLDRLQNKSYISSAFSVPPAGRGGGDPRAISRAGRSVCAPCAPAAKCSPRCGKVSNRWCCVAPDHSPWIRALLRVASTRATDAELGDVVE